MPRALTGSWKSLCVYVLAYLCSLLGCTGVYMEWGLKISLYPFWLGHSSLLIPNLPVQFSSEADPVRLCDLMDCTTPGFPIRHHLLGLAQTQVHWVGDAIHPSHTLLSPVLLPSVFPSIRVFSNKSVLYIKWPNCWSFSFSISPSNAYSGWISFRIDWFDLLAVQGTLKSLLHSSPHFSKASVLWCSAFCIIQLLTFVHDSFPPDTNQMSIAVLGFDILHML